MGCLRIGVRRVGALRVSCGLVCAVSLSAEGHIEVTAGDIALGWKGEAVEVSVVSDTSWTVE